jgi:hypothetical protein
VGSGIGIAAGVILFHALAPKSRLADANVNVDIA